MSWRDMGSAPKDGTPILVKFDHDADPYFVEDGRYLTTYGAHADGLSCWRGKGYCVVVWGGEYYDGEGDGYIPPWWFDANSEHEVVVNPIAWMPIEGATA